ncbi:MAG: hypothetical protein Q7S21_07935 [archaeon]|nr:hypothetical protein [archaeon]
MKKTVGSSKAKIALRSTQPKLCKGFYTAVIGLLAIMLISTTLILVRTNQQFERNYGTAKAFPDIKAELQNAQYILDLTATDAISDSIDQTNCSLDTPANIQTRIKDYLNNSLNEMNSNCKINETKFFVNQTAQTFPQQPDGRIFAVNELTASFDLDCSLTKTKNSQKEAEIIYSRYTESKKQIVLLQGASECKFSIIDSRSGMPEKFSDKLDPLIPGSIVIEAESFGNPNTTIIGMFDNAQDSQGASNGKYIETSDPNQGTATYSGITLPAGAVNNPFSLCGRAVATNTGNDSFNVNTITAPNVLWNVLDSTIDTGYSKSGPIPYDWKWDTANGVSMLLSGAPQTLTISGAEPGTKLDKIMIIPYGYACPTQFAYYQCTGSAC